MYAARGQGRWNGGAAMAEMERIRRGGAFTCAAPPLSRSRAREAGGLRERHRFADS